MVALPTLSVTPQKEAKISTSSSFQNTLCDAYPGNRSLLVLFLCAAESS